MTAVETTQIPRPHGPRRGAVCVDELQRAWRAVQEGRFRARPTHLEQAPPTDPSDVRDGPGRDGPGQDGPGRTWVAPGRVVPVLGCSGSVGASTVAVAIAETLQRRPARVVECGPPTRSGLVGAATAELGPAGPGWVRGRRGQVVIDRVAAPVTDPADVPVPVPGPVPSDLAAPEVVTVLDVGWDLDQVQAARSWLTDQMVTAPVVVLVAFATVPGMRHLDRALAAVARARPDGHPVTPVIVVRGPARWPRRVRAAAGPVVSGLAAAGLVVTIRDDRALAVRGLDSTPLPRAVRQGAVTVANLLDLDGPPPGVRDAGGLTDLSAEGPSS